MGYPYKKLWKLNAVPTSVLFCTSPYLALALLFIFCGIQLILITWLMTRLFEWHFYRLRLLNVKAFPVKLSIWTPSIYLLSQMLPGCIALAISTGFIFWPLSLLISGTELLLSRKKWKSPPKFFISILNYQRSLAISLLKTCMTEKKLAFYQSLIHCQRLPPELVNQIMTIVDGNLGQETLAIMKLLTRKKTRKRSFFAHYFQDTEEIEFFSKDMSIFAFLVLIQISVPYWLYHLS